MPAITMHAASVAVFDRMLGNLSRILDKAEAHCAARKIEPSVLLGMRLAPDMFALARQVQLASDFAKGPSARLAGVEIPKHDDTEATYADLKARIAKTQGFIRGLDPKLFEGSEHRDISLKLAGQPVTMNGLAYLFNVGMPNFYFHLTTAYGILRHAGVELGKLDYVGGPG